MGTVSCLSINIHYTAIHSCTFIAQFKQDSSSVHTAHSTNFTSIQECNLINAKILHMVPLITDDGGGLFISYASVNMNS